MRVTAIETLHADAYPHLLWVRVHTDAGLVGLGETFWGPRTVAEHVHEGIAPLLLGQDPLEIERHRAAIGRRGLRALGAEGRALSAVDIALWDLLGQARRQPIHTLLGGSVHDRVRVYNTCAGYRHIPDWGIGGPTDGPYEDHAGTFERPEDLAQSLLSEGITAMKIWPFEADPGRATISNEAIERGLEPFRRIRRAVGDQMDLLLDCGRWTLPLATRIVRAVEEHEPFWIEDPVPADRPELWRELAAETRVPLAGGEDLGGAEAFDALLEGGVAIPLFDPGWVGGISEARSVIDLARARGRPFCPHDCTGPISFIVGVHLCFSASNAMMQEYVRAYYHGAYRQLVTELPRVDGGFVYAPTGSGLCTELSPELLGRSDLQVRLSRLSA